MNLILPSIVELYIHTLSLSLLKKGSLEGDLSDDMVIIIENFLKSVEIAEKIFGSSDIVQRQLDILAKSIGDA